ncbi:MAG: hypothetical protein H0T42_18855 [Deltaproteobacteria bacterium]|nr:hypothetical protein [Deltaproteobacteria bacterium]
MTKHITWVIGAVLALVACGKAEDRTSAAPKKEPVSPEPAKKSGLELFTGKVPAPPPPVDKIKPGMPGEQARALAPEVFAADYGYKLPGYNGVEIKVIFQDKSERVQETKIDLAEPLETVKAELTKRWGEPRARSNSNGAAVYYWDHPASGVRAMLEARTTNSVIHFGEVMSVEQLLGTTRGRLGFETTPILGANKETVMKVYGAREPSARTDDPESLFFSLPPLDTSEYGGSIDVRFKNDIATGYTLNTSFSWEPATKAKLLAGLEKLFGAATPDLTYLDFPGPPKVKVDHDGTDQLVVWVADYKK